MADRIHQPPDLWRLGFWRPRPILRAGRGRKPRPTAVFVSVIPTAALPAVASQSHGAILVPGRATPPRRWNRTRSERAGLPRPQAMDYRYRQSKLLGSPESLEPDGPVRSKLRGGRLPLESRRIRLRGPRFHCALWRSAFTGQISYTWSHSLDNQSDPLAGIFEDYNQAGIANKPDIVVNAAFTRQFDSHDDRASSDFDQRHNLVFFAVYSIPGRLFRGWRVSGLGFIRSGLPYKALMPPRTGVQRNHRLRALQPARRSHQPLACLCAGKPVDSGRQARC